VQSITTINLGDGKMALKETTAQLQALLEGVTKDLEKGSRGNKAASQRVRTGTVKLEKIAKLYRKQSVASEKTVKPKKGESAGKVEAAKAKPSIRKKKTSKSSPKRKTRK
jgi:hypothetical protein